MGADGRAHLGRDGYVHRAGRPHLADHAIGFRFEGRPRRHDPERHGEGFARDARPLRRAARRPPHPGPQADALTIANHEEENTVQTVTPSLTFKDGAEDALKLYVSVIRNSKIVNIMRSEGGPIAKGKVLHATFELDGREFTAMDGGPSFSFTEGFSLVATCETQQELDE